MRTRVHVERDESCGRGCKNCAYYFQHYILSAEGRFEKIPHGHCTNGNYTLAQSKKIIRNGLSCGFWVERQRAVEGRTERIVVQLRRMADRLEGIAALLKNYND